MRCPSSSNPRQIPYHQERERNRLKEKLEAEKRRNKGGGGGSSGSSGFASFFGVGKSKAKEKSDGNGDGEVGNVAGSDVSEKEEIEQREKAKLELEGRVEVRGMKLQAIDRSKRNHAVIAPTFATVITRSSRRI